jgi:tetratricopeptide (TPR) repeat protein
LPLLKSMATGLRKFDFLFHSFPYFSIFDFLKKHFLILFACFVFYGHSQNPYSTAKTYFLKNDIESALASLDSCSNLKEYADSALYFKAYLSIKNNHLEDAQNYCHELQKRNKDYFEVWFLKGLISSINKKYVQAAEQFTKVLNHEPDNLKALYNRSLSKAMLEDYQSAISDLNKCIRIDSTYANAYYSRAYWLETTENYEAAIHDYQKTISLNKNYNEAYLALAYALQKKGDRKKACEALQQAIDKGVTAAHDLKDNFCK